MLIGVQDEDSCGKSGVVETPQAKPRRLHTCPRKAKSCAEINSGVEKCQNIKKLLHSTSMSDIIRNVVTLERLFDIPICHVI
jgi:hypothetical protein